MLVNSWEVYRQSLVTEGAGGNEDEAHTSPHLSPSKRRRVEAGVVCRATKGPKKIEFSWRVAQHFLKFLVLMHRP